MEVIPAINCNDRDTECVVDKLHKAEPFSEWIHLDVADGLFTFNKTWADHEAWKGFDTKLKLEVHLMVEEPEKYVEAWLKAGAKRLIVHVETLTEDSAKLIKKNAEAKGAEVMLSSNPETQVESLRPYLGSFSSYQVLFVNPGFAGQRFLPAILDKVKFLRNEVAGAKIEVDGGINYETGKLAKDAGADMFVVASYVFGNENPKKAYETLKSL